MVGNPSVANHPDLDQWIELSNDERVIVHTGKVEIGQRITTALAIIAAEELDVDFDRIDIKPTETGIDPNEGFTAGSMSMMHSGVAVRIASATARRYLLKIAASKLQVDIATLEVEDGLIQSRETNSSVTYWDLFAGKKFNTLVDENVPLKAPENFTKVGRRVIPKGMTEIVKGQMSYIHDMRLPDMLHARLVRPPHYLASLKSLDDHVISRLTETGIQVVRNGSFIAIVAADEYAAVKSAARVAATADWDLHNGLEISDLYKSLITNKRISLPVIEGGAPVDKPVPPLDAPPADAVVTLAASFEKPYHMHGSIGPSAGCALYEGGKLTVWTHSQGVYPLRSAMAEALKISTEEINVKFVPGAGCYGHNGADDAAFDAALIALAIPDTPILLKWTREDEHAWEPYGSAMVCNLRGSVDSDGKIIDWSHESYGDTFMGRPAPDRAGSPAKKLLSTHYLRDSLDWDIAPPVMGPHVGVHRNLEPLYLISRKRLVKNLVRNLPLRTSALRTLGAFANVVAIEAFMDELAEASRINPTEFRINHLNDERAKNVIEALAEKMETVGAGSDKGVGSGMAFAQYKNSAAYCAVGIEVEVTDAAEIKLLRAWITADAGEVVDPDGLTAQLEGGLIQAASWTLHERVTYDSSGITSRNWDTYPILRFDNIPAIETILLERPGMPFLGAGEAVAGPTGGAIANAIHSSTGLRLRRMPFNPDAIRRAALSK